MILEKIKLKYKPLGSISVLIEWPAEIDTKILNNIGLLDALIHKKLKKYTLETVPAYRTLTVFFDTNKIKYSDFVGKVKDLLKGNVIKQLPVKKKKLWKIPVCYDEAFGFDLALIAKENKITKKDIIKEHSKTIYDVYFIGFLPGFLYLGGLPESIHCKRKEKPLPKIEKGAVGIGGSQTGIYPRKSPGGWNIIGNSPINFFDVNKKIPCFAEPGDKIQFFSVNMEEYISIKEKVTLGKYKIESTAYGC